MISERISRFQNYNKRLKYACMTWFSTNVTQIIQIIHHKDRLCNTLRTGCDLFQINRHDKDSRKPEILNFQGTQKKLGKYYWKLYRIACRILGTTEII